MEEVKLILGDCLEVMRSMDDKSDSVVVYMYRGNGYFSKRDALDKKRKDNDQMFADVKVTPVLVPLCDIYKQRKETDWISVKDRLPDRYGEYIVAYDYGGTGTNYYNTPERLGHRYEEPHWAYNGHEHITHWMPFPEPPQGA